MNHVEQTYSGIQSRHNSELQATKLLKKHINTVMLKSNYQRPGRFKVHIASVTISHSSEGGITTDCARRVWLGKDILDCNDICVSKPSNAY